MDTIKLLEEVLKIDKYAHIDKDPIDIRGIKHSITQLLYCPLKYELEKEIKIPLEFKITMLKGIAVHDWFENLLKNYSPERFVVEKIYYKYITVNNQEYTIVGKPDLIDTQEHVVIELKDYGSYRIKKQNMDEWLAERERVIEAITNNLPIHYVEQLVLYSWLTEIQRLQLVLFTDIYPIDIKLFVQEDPLTVTTNNNTTYYVYPGPVFLKNKKDTRPLNKINEFVEAVINRFYESQASQKPIWYWECGYCYFCKAQLCRSCPQ